MILIKSAKTLSDYIKKQTNNKKSIGFVPTMGALHDGHLSLIKLATDQNEITVCSLFVNPTQFNNPDDFEKYPTTIGKDIDLLSLNNCDVLFLPQAIEIYPSGFKAKHYAIEELESILEGYYRPGHFQGVCQVVDRLLEIVQPTNLYLGQKDFQQCKVVEKLLSITGNQQIGLRIAPTIREADGLAMSSRNMRLSIEQRKQAAVIFQVLQHAKNNINKLRQNDIIANAIGSLNAAGFNVDYFTIVDKATLEPANESTKTKIALVAAFLGDVRLIDNMVL